MLNFIAFNALKNAVNQNVKSLQYWALKVVVKKRRRADDTTNILFSLIFKQRLNIWHFVKLLSRGYGRYWPPSTTFVTIHHIRYHRLLKPREDPYIIYALLEQNMENRDNFINLIIGRRNLIIEYCKRTTLALIPNREDHEFDTFWALEFFKLCLKTRRNTFRLEIDGEGQHERDYMSRRINSIVDSAGRYVPPEGWEQAILRGERMIYERTDKYHEDFLQNETRFSTTFAIATKYNSNLADERYYAFRV